MTESTSRQIEVTFHKHNHYWLDAGLVGLCILLEEISHNSSMMSIHEDSLVLKGTIKDINEILNGAYGLLIGRYYDISTEAQKSDKSRYNFYYDSKQDKFVPFSKKNSVGLVKLIYPKAARPEDKDKAIKWAEKKEGILPPRYAALQPRLNEFLKTTGLKITTKSLLVDAPNTVRPKIKIDVSEKKPAGRCFLCGEESGRLEDINQTIYPFITGNSGELSFNSMGGKPERACWKCSFLGKFVPVTAFYMTQGEELYAFIPYSSSLTTMKHAYDGLRLAYVQDPNYYRNFDLLLGNPSTFRRRSEVLFAFLYTISRKLQSNNSPQQHQLNPADLTRLFGSLAEDFIGPVPIEFIVLHARQKGKTTMGEAVWTFKDSVYFFRLVEFLESGSNHIRLKEVMSNLIDETQKSEGQTIIRDRVCERVLKKQSVLGLIETLVYCPNTKFPNRVAPLFDFVCTYEPIIRTKGGNMTDDDQKAAVALGKRIGMSIGSRKDGKKADKGGLYALRRVRRKTDFLNELNRLQFKYGLVIPPDVYEGHLTDTNFPEFKSFCMIAALNSFEAATYTKSTSPESEKEEK